MDEDPLILEALPYTSKGRGVFMVWESFEHAGVIVPAGFVSDLCSLPWFARAFLPQAGPVAKPAILHDWLLACGEVDLANVVFAETLKEAGVNPASRWIMIVAVKIYWWFKRLGEIAPR